MKLNSDSISEEIKSYKIKPVFYTFAILGIAEAFSFLNSEGTWIKIFFISTFLALSCFIFYLLKKRGKYTLREIYLYWAVVAFIIICSAICIIIKYSEEQLISKNKIPTETFNTSFTGNTLGQLNIYNMPSEVNSGTVINRALQTPEGISNIPAHIRNTPASMTGSDKKQEVSQNKRSVYIEEETPLPIMDVPKGADNKKTIKPILPLNT